MNKPISLTHGPISHGLIKLAFPILCANVLQSLNGTVSAFWVGRSLGEAALTAITNAQSMMFLLTGAAFGITMAATILVAQRTGVDDVAAAKRVVSTGVIFFSTLSIALSALGVVFSEPLLITMRTASEVLPLALPYLRLMLLALPSMYLLTFVMSILLGLGDSTTPLKFVLLSVFLAMVLTPTFVLAGEAIAGAGAGVVGAALAMFAAQGGSLIALLRHLYSRRHPLCISAHDMALFNVDWSIVRELAGKGVPMGTQALVISLSSVLMITLVNSFGVTTTAAYAALMQLWTYILMPAVAMAVAVSTMAAQNVGAQNWSRVRSIARLGMAWSFLVTGAIVALTYAAESHVYRLFVPAESAALNIANHINSIVTWSLMLMSIPLVLFGVMRAAGAVMVPLLVHVVSLLIVRYPLALLLLNRWQADAIWWSFTISTVVDVVLAILYYRYGRWHRMERWRLTGSQRVVPDSDPRSRERTVESGR